MSTSSVPVWDDIADNSDPTWDDVAADATPTWDDIATPSLQDEERRQIEEATPFARLTFPDAFEPPSSLEPVGAPQLQTSAPPPEFPRQVPSIGGPDWEKEMDAREPITRPEDRSAIGKLFDSTAQAPVRIATFGTDPETGKTTIPWIDFKSTVEAENEGTAGGLSIAEPVTKILADALPEGKIKDLATGAYNAAANLINFFLSPQGASMGGISKLPTAAQKLVSGGFAAYMLKNAPDQLQSGDDALKRGDLRGAVENWLGGVGSIGMAGLAGKHAVTAKSKVAPVRYEGTQTEPGGIPKQQWSVTEDVPGLEKGSTYSPETIQAAGYTLPEIPKDWKQPERVAFVPNQGEPKPIEAASQKSTETVKPDAGKSTPVVEEQKMPAPVLEAQPEMVGVGASALGETSPPVPFKTSNKNATVDAERKARGLPPMMDTVRSSNQSAWDEAMQKVDENPQIQEELITELSAQPRAVTPVENAMLMHRRIDLRNEYEKALLRWKQAFESNDMVRAAEESQRVRDWSSKLSDLEDITKRTGAESGRSLQARKMMANEDFSLAAMELRAMESKGRNLTPEEHVELIKAQQRIVELENRLSELESGRESKEVEAQTAETLKEVSKEAPREAKSKDFDIDREETLVGSIKAKIEKGQQNEITPLVQQLARVFWRRGIREREPMIDALHETLKTIVPDFTRDQTQRAFSGYGDFTPLSKAEIDVGLRDLRGQTQQVLKLEALEARKPLEKTGQERRVPSDDERRLIKQVNELKRKYGVVTTDPATQLKSALQSRKTYYEHRISDLKHEIETRQRIVKTKSASPRDAELDAMIAEHERLKAEHEQIFGEREMTDEQRLKMALSAAERNQAHWEVRLNNAEKGIYDKRTPGRKVTSPELELIQAETAAIREHVKELKDLANPKKTKEEIALQSLKTRMKTRTADYLRRIAEGDFSKKERKPVALDSEGNKIKAELDIAKEQFETKLEQDRWAKLSVFQKTKRKTADLYDAARAIMTTGEFSFILRQGKWAALSHPIQTAKALPDTFRALLGSEAKVKELELEVINDPLAPLARQDKLFIDEHGTKLSRADEILMGRLVGNIPVVRNFNNAARVFLNKTRMDMWKAMRKSMTKTGTPTPEEGRQIAMFVNESTGRGGLGKLEPAAVPLARVMFSPRYYASRLQLASGHSMWGGTMRSRRIIATEYARSLIGLGLYYTVLSMYFSGDKDKGKIESDPRSTDFGKVKIGDTRLDPLAGLSQVIVLGSRTATGEKKTLKGDVQPIRGPEVKFGGDQWSDIMARHLRGKLHPVPSSIANLFDGTDMGGDEATVLNQAGNMIAPITYIDIYTALKEQDLDDGTALSLLAILGEGLQTYKAKEKQK